MELGRVNVDITNTVKDQRSEETYYSSKQARSKFIDIQSHINFLRNKIEKCRRLQEISKNQNRKNQLSYLGINKANILGPFRVTKKRRLKAKYYSSKIAQQKLSVSKFHNIQCHISFSKIITEKYRKLQIVSKRQKENIQINALGVDKRNIINSGKIQMLEEKYHSVKQAPQKSSVSKFNDIKSQIIIVRKEIEKLIRMQAAAKNENRNIQFNKLDTYLSDVPSSSQIRTKRRSKGKYYSSKKVAKKSLVYQFNDIQNRIDFLRKKIKKLRGLQSVPKNQNRNAQLNEVDIVKVEFMSAVDDQRSDGKYYSSQLGTQKPTFSNFIGIQNHVAFFRKKTEKLRRLQEASKYRNIIIQSNPLDKDKREIPNLFPLRRKQRTKERYYSTNYATQKSSASKFKNMQNYIDFVRKKKGKLRKLQEVSKTRYRNVPFNEFSIDNTDIMSFGKDRKTKEEYYIVSKATPQESSVSRFNDIQRHIVFLRSINEKLRRLQEVSKCQSKNTCLNELLRDKSGNLSPFQVTKKQRSKNRYDSKKDPEKSSASICDDIRSHINSIRNISEKLKRLQAISNCRNSKIQPNGLHSDKVYIMSRIHCPVLNKNYENKGYEIENSVEKASSSLIEAYIHDASVKNDDIDDATGKIPSFEKLPVLPLDIKNSQERTVKSDIFLSNLNIEKKNPRDQDTLSIKIKKEGRLEKQDSVSMKCKKEEDDAANKNILLWNIEDVKGYEKGKKVLMNMKEQGYEKPVNISLGMLDLYGFSSNLNEVSTSKLLEDQKHVGKIPIMLSKLEETSGSSHLTCSSNEAEVREKTWSKASKTHPVIVKAERNSSLIDKKEKKKYEELSRDFNFSLQKVEKKKFFENSIKNTLYLDDDSPANEYIQGVSLTMQTTHISGKCSTMINKALYDQEEKEEEKKENQIEEKEEKEKEDEEEEKEEEDHFKDYLGRFTTKTCESLTSNLLTTSKAAKHSQLQLSNDYEKGRKFLEKSIGASVTMKGKEFCVNDEDNSISWQNLNLEAVQKEEKEMKILHIETMKEKKNSNLNDKSIDGKEVMIDIANSNMSKDAINMKKSSRHCKFHKKDGEASYKTKNQYTSYPQSILKKNDEENKSKRYISKNRSKNSQTPVESEAVSKKRRSAEKRYSVKKQKLSVSKSNNIDSDINILKNMNEKLIKSRAAAKSQNKNIQLNKLARDKTYVSSPTHYPKESEKPLEVLNSHTKSNQKQRNEIECLIEKSCLSLIETDVHDSLIKDIDFGDNSDSE